MLSSPAFLNVEHSLSGKRWVGPGVELDRQAQHLVQMTGHPPAVCSILARLGVAAEEVEQYLARRCASAA